MATFTATIPDFSLSSTWTVVRDPVPGMTTPTTASTTKDFTITGITTGSTINSAVLTATLGSPLTGAAIRTVAIEGGSNQGFSGSLDVTSAVAASFGAGDNTISALFRFKANGTTDHPVGSRSSSLTFKNVKITIEYTLPYTACTAPTTVTVSPTSGGPGFSSTLSWSGASGGTNNPIKHYQVQRSIDGGAWANLTTTTSTSVSVTGHATNGKKHAYRVISIATQAGYDSGASGTATQTTSFSAPSAPTSVSVSSAYVTSGNVTLSWSGATAGTNNPIKSYSIYRNGSAYTTSTGTSVSVPSNTGGNYYTYTVYTIGTHSNSGASSGATVYTYTNPTAPTNVKVAQTVINAGTSTTLSWTAGSNGHYNAISEYHVYRRTNGSGNYTYLNKTTGTSLSVTAHGTMTSYYDYVVYSIGLRSNSGASGSARLTTKNYTKVNAPTTVSVSSTHVTGGNVTLSWSGASGGTNTTVASYQVYRNGTVYGNPTTGSSMAVPSASAGNSYTYTVVAISSPAGYNSSASSGAIVRTYGAPSAPTTVTINGVAGTTYFGNQGRPTITLAWSGASAGTYGSISKYIVYRDGTSLKETTSTSTVVTADGTYTVRTVASGGTSGHSVGRAVTTIGAPTFNQFTGQPSGKSNGNVSYSWSANAAPANSSLVYHVAYRNGGTGSTWIAGTGATASYTFNVNSYITQGNYYQLGVLVRANATHGGYRDATAGYVFSSANTAYRAAAPAKPTNLVFKDQGGNTSYSTNQVNLTFSYSVPTRGANVSRYEIFYKYGKTGGYTKLVDNYNGSVTHNIASVAAGLQIYYKVEVVDEYGYRNSVESGDTYITKLVMPTISNASFTPTDVPNTTGKLVFTPGNGGVSRPLKYSARILYNGQSYSLTGFTQVPSPGSALTFTKTGMGISALNSAGMTSLFSYVITNANVTPVITVEITVADNQTIPVVGNQTVHTFTYTANYRTTPTLNGTLTLSNATATANSKTISYVNSEDELAVSTSGMSVSWTNAAGTTVGQNLTYRLTYQGITDNLSGFPSNNLVKTKLGVFTGDTTVTASLVIIQSFKGGVTTSSATKSASISAKRFIKPSITFANSERTAGTVFKTRIGISDSLCGGSSTANNIEDITSLKITAGTTVNTIQNSAVASNKWKINDTVVPVNISNLNASAIADVNVSASATLTLTSGRTVTINSTPFLLKALGVALAIRKTRVGINVEPTSFVESANSPSFVIVENQLNTTTPYILDIQSAVGNDSGVGIRLFDTKRNSSTILTYKDNHFRINKRIHAMATSSSATVAGSPDHAGLIVHNTSSTYGLATGVLSNGQAWLQAQRFDGGSTLYGLNLNPLGGQVNINGQLALNATNYSSYALPLSGGTMTGRIVFPMDTYAVGWGGGAMDMRNSDIVGINGLFFQDAANVQNEGIHFWRSLTHADTFRIHNGAILFTPNRPLEGSAIDYTVLHTGNISSLISASSIGAAPASHGHSYLPLSGGAMDGRLMFWDSHTAKLTLYRSSLWHTIGTQSYYIQYGGYNTETSLFEGHKFYSHPSTLVAQIGSGNSNSESGEINSTKSKFFGNVDFTGSVLIGTGYGQRILILNNEAFQGEAASRIEFRLSDGQHVQLRHNSHDLVRAPYGLHIEKTSDNTQQTAKAYLDVEGDIYSNNYKVFHAGNYTDYTVTKTGSGASGTWPITASGNLPLTGGTMTGSAIFPDGAGIHNSASYILLGYNSSVGTGTTVASSQGITRIRSSTTTNLVHRVGSTEYPILTSSNYTSYVTPAGIGAATAGHGHSSFANNLLLETSDGIINVTPTGWRSFPRASIKLLSKTNNPAELDLYHTVDGQEVGWQISARSSNESAQLRFYARNDSGAYTEIVGFNQSGGVSIGGNTALHTGNYTTWVQKKITYGTSLPTSGMATGDIFIKI